MATIDTLEELKKHFPKGHHAPNPNTENAFEASGLVQQKTQVPGINTNHGWKLHADLKAELTMDEAYAKIGLSPVKGPSGRRFATVDQDLFTNFQKRVSSLGVDLSSMKSTDDRIRWLHKFMLQGGSPTFGGQGKFVDPNDTLSLVELLGENDIGYKTSSAYGEGRQFTFYSQSIEERDRIISILESSNISDRLEDQYDPAYRKTITEDIENKNAPISQKTSGRFTTDYLNPYYVDDNGRPYLDLQHDPTKSGFKDRPGRTLATPAQVAENEKLRISGRLDQADALAADKILKDFPEMSELLHGKPGYVTPYASIQDQIEYRKKFGAQGKVIFGSSSPSPPTPTPPVTVASKPIGKPVPRSRPVIPAAQVSPPPAPAVSQAVTQSGNATPRAAISAAPRPTSTGAPLPATSAASRSLADNMSQAVTKGIKGSGGLKMLGAAALVGLGAGAISGRRTQQENIDRRLEMQRRGMIT